MLPPLPRAAIKIVFLIFVHLAIQGVLVRNPFSVLFQVFEHPEEVGMLLAVMDLHRKVR